jgi:hypothetical protein
MHQYHRDPNWQKHLGKLFWIRFSLLWVALALAIALAYIYFVRIPQTERLIEQLSTKRTMAETSAVTTKTARVALWKPYKNWMYGFEFKYPSDWNVETSEDSRIAVFVKPGRDEEIAHYQTDTGSEFTGRRDSLTVEVTTVGELLDGSLDLETWLKNTNPNAVENIVVGGKPGYKQTYAGKTEGSTVYIQVRSRVYILDFAEDIEGEQQTLLATFIFN